MKLMLIGIIPVLFLIYLSNELYKEKKQRVTLIADYIDRIHQSGDITNAISELENERKYSYEYALKKNSYGKLTIQRTRTNAAVEMLAKSKDPSITNFEQYTFLNKLSEIRTALDTSLHFSSDAVMQYYTNTIFRLNTLNTVASASNIYLQPVSKDLIAQRKLFEMITFLGIIRTNIYNALYTRRHMTKTLLGTLGLYNVFKTYETEFLLKASPASVKTYEDQKNNTELKPTLDYITKLFTSLNFDTTYTANQWWSVSSQGRTVLKKQQLGLWQRAESGMKEIYQQERKSRNRTLIFLIVAIILVTSFVAYTIRIISEMLRELKVAAEKISVGGTGLQFNDMPNDVMGSVAQSILEIDRNNIELAHAASAIGKGDFNTQVKPRGSEDVLGNSIAKMKEDLHKLTLEKDKVQHETLELMNRKDDFLSIASHELKTPITSLKAYTHLLYMDVNEEGDTKREMMLSKMDAQIDKLTALITDLLDTSKLQNGKLVYSKHVFQLQDLVTEIVVEMQASTSTHQIIIKKNTPLHVYADRARISQVLSNLVSNAIKYCPDCGRLLISVEKDGEEAICSVQDFGNGIIPGQQDKIFERFYRISGNNLHTYPGLGLGLYISKEIVEKHHGKIWIESVTGKGSTFYFSLPVTDTW
ncbi:MAG: HAMP domain-containing sensor histidine kinase [Ginsengibacter sp.]